MRKVTKRKFYTFGPLFRKFIEIHYKVKNTAERNEFLCEKRVSYGKITKMEKKFARKFAEVEKKEFSWSKQVHKGKNFVLE